MGESTPQPRVTIVQHVINAPSDSVQWGDIVAWFASLLTRLSVASLALFARQQRKEEAQLAMSFVTWAVHEDRDLTRNRTLSVRCALAILGFDLGRT